MSKQYPKRRCPDISKIEKLVGWMPNVSFEEGLRRVSIPVTVFERTCHKK
ncbi:MAG: hypothetical protein ABSB71_01485 [Candidatus Bathyarchaeia archaeon]